MVQSKAKTVAEYLASLPADRRAVVTAVRETILANLGRGFEEGMDYGMIGYHVPHGLYPAGYHCNPKQALPFVMLGAQKNHFVVHMFCLYFDAADTNWFEKLWRASGKKLDMGKCCVRFKRLEDVPLDVLGEAIRRMTLQRFLGSYETALAGNVARKAKAVAKKPAKTTAKAAAKKPSKKVAKKPAAKRAR